MIRRCLAVVFLVFVGCANTAPVEFAAQRIVAEPLPTPQPVVEIVEEVATPEPPPPSPPPTPKPAPTRIAAAAPPPPPEPVANIDAFRNLGSWIDVYDHGDDPATILPMVRGMAKQGVKTLYLESARYDDTQPLRYPTAVGAAVEEAHKLGMLVIAWYPPDFADPERDFQNSIGAIRWVSPNGHRFDGFAPDIEYTAGVPDHDERGRRAVAYSQRLRSEVGLDYPLAIITIPPSSLSINPGRWPNFPWAAMGGIYDVVMPMNYWTGRSADPQTAAALTEENVRESARLTGLPVHPIGGLGDKIDRAQAQEYVRVTLEAGGIGGSVYDYRITPADIWEDLRGLNR